MVEEPKWVEPLYAAVAGRLRPEDVAKTVLKLFPNPPHKLRWRVRTLGRSYLPVRFDLPTPLTRTANVLALLLGEPELTDEESVGPKLDALLVKGRQAIAATEGGLDFKADRRNRESRSAAGLTLSRRRYNKLFRLIAFLEREREGNLRHQELTTLLREAKTSLVRHLPRETFARDANTAVFVAYMAARMGLRSEFTIDPQQRAFDDLSEALFGTLEKSSTTEWAAVAYVFPRSDVLSRVGDEGRLRLLGLAGATMERAARVLDRIPGVDPQKGFVVQRGQDSSSWNAAAGAWNKARDFWLGLSDSLGFDVSGFLPGKVPRLMASDVVAWSRIAGKGAHPDEAVAQLLPAPWKVLLEGAPCSEEMVREACRQVGVDPDKTGWTAPHARTAVETWKPTPELVYGVAVANPELALLMRRMGWFSGPAKWERERYGESSSEET